MQNAFYSIEKEKKFVQEMAKQTIDETNICIYFATTSDNYVGRLVWSVFVVNMTFKKSIFSKKRSGEKNDYHQQIHIAITRAHKWQINNTPSK